MMNFYFSLVKGLILLTMAWSMEACTEPNTNMEKQIAEALEAKYQESFKITDVVFAKGLNLYEFTASPKKNKKLQFQGQFDERKPSPAEQLVTDSYPNHNLSFSAQERFQKMVHPLFSPVATSCTVYSRTTHTFGKSVISMADFLENRNPKSTIRHNMYVFQSPESPADPMINNIQQIIGQLAETYGSDFSLFIGFWNPSFLEGKNFEKLTWGFESTSHEDADDILNVMSSMDHVLFLKVISSAGKNLSHEEIFKLMEKHNKKGQNEMKEI